MLDQATGNAWILTLDVGITHFIAWGKLHYPTPGKFLIKIIICIDEWLQCWSYSWCSYIPTGLRGSRFHDEFGWFLSNSPVKYKPHYLPAQQCLPARCIWLAPGLPGSVCIIDRHGYQQAASTGQSLNPPACYYSVAWRSQTAWPGDVWLQNKCSQHQAVLSQPASSCFHQKKPHSCCRHAQGVSHGFVMASGWSAICLGTHYLGVFVSITYSVISF